MRTQRWFNQTWALSSRNPQAKNFVITFDYTLSIVPESHCLAMSHKVFWRSPWLWHHPRSAFVPYWLYFCKKLLISVSCPYWFQYSLHTAISLILLKYTTFICYSSVQIPSETQCGKVRLHCLAFKILIICCYLHILISILMWLLSSVCPKQSSSYSRGSVCAVSPFEMFSPSLKQFYSSFKVFSQESFYGNCSLFSEFWYHLQWGFRI